MHVPIQQQDARQPQLLLRDARGNRRVIERAKAHNYVTLRMVSRRPIYRDRARHSAAEHRFHRLYAAPRRQTCARIRVTRHVRVGRHQAVDHEV